MQQDAPPQKPKGKDYAIILVVFAVTGSTAALAPRFFMPWTGLESGFWYWLVYFLFITPIYQVLLLGYAWLFGKFDYFWEKEKRVFRWVAGLFGGKGAGRDQAEEGAGER
jgi:hypothetical protein